MKVLFTTNIPSPYRVDFFNELGRYCELTVVFEREYDDERDEIWKNYSFDTFKGVFLTPQLYGNFKEKLTVLNFIRNKHFDIIVVGFYSSLVGILTINYLRFRKIPYIISSDGGIIKERRGIRYYFKKLLIGGADGWLSTGQKTTQYFANYGANINKICVYPFASMKRSQMLSHNISMEEKRRYKDMLNIESDRMVLAVGQFIYRKGFDVLIDACSLLPDDIILYIVGGKPTEEYQHHVKELGLENRIRFADFMAKDKLKIYYLASDVFVLPTREDIWGLVINEAMSMGLPVVTTNKCNAGLEMIHEGLNGYIVESENSLQLANGIEAAFLLNGNESVKTASQYSIENMVSTHVLFFQEYLDNYISSKLTD